MECVHEIGAFRNPELPIEVLVLRLSSLEPPALIGARGVFSEAVHLELVLLHQTTGNQELANVLTLVTLHIILGG